MDKPLKLKLTIKSGPSITAKVVHGGPGLEAGFESDRKGSVEVGTDVGLRSSIPKGQRAGVISDAVRIADGSDLPSFDGPYVIVPTIEGFGMSTKGKKMTSDLEVEPIPIARTSNPSGGYTCVIG